MDRRGTFITAAAITGVVIAGTTAVAANIGILNAADGDNVGDLSASAATAPLSPTSSEPQIVDVYLEEPTSTVVTVESAPPTTQIATETATASSTDGRSQEFAVDVAGTVRVDLTDDGGVILAGVAPSDGWTWTGSQTSATELAVTFTSASAEYVFHASVGADGLITARVDQPIVEVVQVPASPAGSASTGPAPTATSPVPTTPSEYDDDDHEDDDDDDHEDDDDDDDDDHDDDDHEDHEGGEDDD